MDTNVALVVVGNLWVVLGAVLVLLGRGRSFHGVTMVVVGLMVVSIGLMGATLFTLVCVAVVFTLVCVAVVIAHARLVVRTVRRNRRLRRDIAQREALMAITRPADDYDIVRVKLAARRFLSSNDD